LRKLYDISHFPYFLPNGYPACHNPKAGRNNMSIETTIICNNCNIAIIDGSEHDINDMILCDNCYNEHYDICSCCGDVVHNRSITHYRNAAYCDSCFDDFFGSCSGCDEIFHHDDLLYCDDDGESYCENCSPSQNRIENLFSYNYKPSPQYYRGRYELKNSDQIKNLYYGIELEIEDEGNTDKEYAIDNLPTFVYAKEDSSLDDGFEIVSYPATYQWLKENTKQWLKILDIRKQGFRSYNTNTCGIHIHLSKNYFSSLHLYKFLSMFYKPDNIKFILRISQRTNDNFRQWCNVIDDGESLTYKARYKNGNYQRYTAVNLQNSHTIEVRIFRGTLNPRSFWKNIEFIQAIVDFTKNTALKEIDEPHFLTYVYNHKREYINLHNWLWDKKFYEKSLEEHD